MVRRPLLVACLCAALGAAVYLAAVHVSAVRTADLRTLDGFMGLWPLPGAGLSESIVKLFDPAPFVLLVLGIAGAGALAGRSRAGLLASGAMVAAAATSQLLKPLLAFSREYPAGHWMSDASWPSGHSTAVMSFALALAIVAPPRLRPIAAALGALLTLATVYSILMLGSHYPTDVIGGFLVATGWTCVAVAPLRTEGRPSLRALAGGPVLAGAVLTTAAAFAVAAQPAKASAYAAANTTFVVGAVAIAAAALLLSGSVLAATGARFRRPSP